MQDYLTAQATLQFIKERKSQTRRLVDYAVHGCPMLLDWSAIGCAVEEAEMLLENLFSSLQMEAEDIISKHEAGEQNAHKSQESTFSIMGAR